MPHESVDHLSAAVFGNRYFARVLESAAELHSANELITTRRIARSLDVPDSVVRPVLLRLVTAHLVVAVPRTNGPRSPQYYEITNHKAVTTLLDGMRAAATS